ncbi:IclR family transcriptional regulator [Halorarum salinum]|uniref:IclR family transcriptional regulator n=1 Tax=Halorarum salinum TaxID=2743089 RepID=A0A7D5QF63_9EURY|nr:IclR family transcriptional regulator [Halobaculum salinum]QLG61162.1 IclR family transcriptional regulator [Halobaculum salinum]
MVESRHPVQTLERALEIVETIQELDGAGITEVAERVDIGKSAVHNHLNTLADEGYIDKVDEQYYIGLSFLSLGSHARKRMSIYDTAKEEIDKLANETGELVNLLVEKNGKGIYLYQSKGENAVELDTYEGKRVHLHCTGLGKAILAFRPEEEVEAILDRHGLPDVSANTITDRDELLDDLEAVQEQHYAIDDEERLNGLRCIAAPVTDENDRSVASISVSCPVHRVDETRFFETLPDAVLGTANVIELEHNYS